MSKKNQKNPSKNTASDTTVQTGRNGEAEAQNCVTRHPDRPNARNGKLSSKRITKKQGFDEYRQNPVAILRQYH